MKKIFCFLFALICSMQIFGAGQSEVYTPVQPFSDLNFMTQEVKGEGPVFWSISPPMKDEDSAYEYCLKETALYAAIYIKCFVSSVQLMQESNTSAGYRKKVSVDYDRNQIAGFIRESIVVYSKKNADVLVLGVKFPSIKRTDFPSVLYDVDLENQTNFPTWIEQPPTASGYLFAVGISRECRYLSDSQKYADEDAFANLARQKSVRLYSANSNYSGTFGNSGVVATAEKTDVTLVHAMIIARWMDNEKNIFFSLAVCID